MLISYNEACAKGCSDLERDLRLCEEAGFDYIEIRLDMLREYLKSHSLGELAAFFEKSRLKPHALNALYLYPEFLKGGEKDGPLLEEFELAMRAGQAIGSHYLIVVPPLWRGEGPYPGDREQASRECARILKRLSAAARPYGMNLCFELVGFEKSSVRTVQEADAIIRQVDEDNVGFVFDSYNLYLNGGSNDFSALGQVRSEKIFAVHLMSGDDVPAEQRGQDKRCFCGRGAVDTDGFLRQLKGCGYEGMVSAETFRPEYWEREPEWVIAEAYRTLREALERNGCL